MAMPFMNRDGRLKSYDVLKWAVARGGPFILRGVLGEFSAQLSDKLDKDNRSLAEKDASERLRKLLKSGMIMVVTTSSLQAFTVPYQTEVRRRNEKTGKWQKAMITVEALLTPAQAEDYTNQVGDLGTAAGRGRKPRVYLATRKGREYVDFREKNPVAGTTEELEEDEA